MILISISKIKSRAKLKGLAKHTLKIFDLVSRLNCIKDYVLAGGTALSLQINHRLSEDFDFIRWQTKDNEKPEVDWPSIEKELKTIDNVKTNVIDFNQVDFIVGGVQITFYANHLYHSPKNFNLLNPKYNINGKEIELEFVKLLRSEMNPI